MLDVTIYHHERADGGMRTGLDVDNYKGIDRYVEGDPEGFDPVLRWFVDVVCPENNPPKNRREAARWLRDHRNIIEGIIGEMAETVECGFDSGNRPVSFEKRTPQGPMRITVSAQRRFEGTYIASRLREFLGGPWKEFLAEHVREKQLT